MITIYTDGSCLGNPGPGGWAAIILEGDAKHVLKGGDVHTTNNRMEMLAVIEALKWLRSSGRNDDVEIFSDSNLLIKTMTEGWKKKANVDLWEEMDEAASEMKIDWNWVKGHSSNKWNNECDRIAVGEAKKQ